jgi:hypothetical protein
MTAQDKGGSKSHYGVKYSELSNLTGGGIGSICDSDFSTSLNLFIDKIVDSLSSVALECAPVGNIAVTINPAVSGLTTRVEGMSVIFNKAVPAGSKIDITYQCDEASRTPSSLKGAKPTAYNELGFFAKIVHFFQNLF